VPVQAHLVRSFCPGTLSVVSNGSTQLPREQLIIVLGQLNLKSWPGAWRVNNVCGDGPICPWANPVLGQQSVQRVVHTKSALETLDHLTQCKVEPSVVHAQSENVHECVDPYSCYSRLVAGYELGRVGKRQKRCGLDVAATYSTTYSVRAEQAVSRRGQRMATTRNHSRTASHIARWGMPGS
jgi:hypothetical protein